MFGILKIWILKLFRIWILEFRISYLPFQKTIAFLMCINCRHNYLSISPRTISMLPIAEITSAIKLPSINLGRALRLRKEGGRILIRKGLFDPSLTR